MIRETIVTTRSAEGVVHIAPLGLIESDDELVIAPFRPSTTLENLKSNPFAVANYCDDVRVFAGCLTGRRDWPTRPAAKVPGVVLEQALAHEELEVTHSDEDPVRPRFRCRIVYSETRAPFRGFNRAQGAVIEGAILVSRLHMLPIEKVDSEIAYLQIALDKTAGPHEREAWDWLMERVAEHRAQTSAAARR